MKIKKKYYTWSDVESMCVSIVNQMYADFYRPDYIVGITRGGNIPATIISNMTGIRCESIKVSLRDNETGKTGDSVDWMADDAYGILDGKIVSGSPTGKKISVSYTHLRAHCLLYTSPSPRDQRGSRMPSCA